MRRPSKTLQRRFPLHTHTLTLSAQTKNPFYLTLMRFLLKIELLISISLYPNLMGSRVHAHD